MRLRLERGPDKAKETLEADAALASVGLYSLALSPGDNSKATLFMARPEGLPPARPLSVEIDVLVDGKRWSGKFELPLDGKELKLGWNGTGFEPVH